MNHCDIFSIRERSGALKFWPCLDKSVARQPSQNSSLFLRTGTVKSHLYATDERLIVPQKKELIKECLNDPLDMFKGLNKLTDSVQYFGGGETAEYDFWTWGSNSSPCVWTFIHCSCSDSPELKWCPRVQKYNEIMN